MEMRKKIFIIKCLQIILNDPSLIMCKSLFQILFSYSCLYMYCKNIFSLFILKKSIKMNY